MRSRRIPSPETRRDVAGVLRPGLPALVLLAVLATGCGQPGNPDLPGTEVEGAIWVSRAPEPSGESEVLVAKIPAAGTEASSWTLDTGERARERLGLARVPPGGVRRTVSRPVDFDAADVSEILLRIGGPDRRQLFLLFTTDRGGRGRITVNLEGGSGVKEYRVDPTGDPAWVGTIQSLAFEMWGYQGALDLGDVDLLRLTPEARAWRLESADHSRLVIRREARPGRVLLEGQTIETDAIPIGKGDSLRFAIGVPRAVANRGGGKLTIRLEGEGFQREIRTARRVRWREIPLDGLGRAGGADSRLKFTLEKAQPGDYVYISTPQIVRASERVRPNVILITADTLRADTMGNSGDIRTRTPYLDAFDRQSIVYENATTASNATCPSHSSIFTSLYPKDHGVIGNSERLTSEAVTLAESFRDAGYQTVGVVGSIVLKSTLSGLGQGFATYHDAGSQMKRSAETVNEDAFEWLEAHRDEPFFAWIHYMDPHTPYLPPDIDREQYLPTSSEGARVPPDGVTLKGFGPDTPNDLRWPIALYRGEVTDMDRNFGILLARLEELGLAENTILAFTADHGESLGEHRIFFKHAGLYSTTTRVPFLLRIPGEAPQRVTAPVETVDIAPTLLSLAGVPIPKDYRGRDVGPSSRVEPRSERGDEVFFQHAGGVAVGLRNGDHHAILRMTKMRLDQLPIEPGLVLFDQQEDPAELRDRAHDDETRRVELERRLARWLEDRRGLTSEPAKLSPFERDALIALGYLDDEADAEGDNTREAEKD